jgi:hypothetical protein
MPLGASEKLFTDKNTQPEQPLPLMQQNCDSIILMPIYTHSDS